MFQPAQLLYTHQKDIRLTPDIQNVSQENDQSVKLYTQSEVDNLLYVRDHSFTSQVRKIEEETQIADKQKRSENRTVAKLVKKSNRILTTISSHAVPIDIFPDTINIEEGRITLIKRHLLSSEIHSIDIKDISNIFINQNFFRSQLVIISRTYEENEIRMRNLITDEAIFARRIIEGLRIFESKQIDTSSYSKEELISKLKELSMTKIVT